MRLFLALNLILIYILSFSVANAQEATLYFFRPEKSAQSGAQSIDVKIILNGEPLALLSNGHLTSVITNELGQAMLMVERIWADDLFGERHQEIIQLQKDQSYYFQIDSDLETLTVTELEDRKGKKAIRKNNFNVIEGSENLSDL